MQHLDGELCSLDKHELCGHGNGDGFRGRNGVEDTSLKNFNHYSSGAGLVLVFQGGECA